MGHQSPPQPGPAGLEGPVLAPHAQDPAPGGVGGAGDVGDALVVQHVVAAHLVGEVGGGQRDEDLVLRGETKGSKIKGKMGIKVAGLGGQNNHQYERGSHEICM